ncbi:MAG: phospholipase D-like domain-containing protein [Nostoc sp.]
MDLTPELNVRMFLTAVFMYLNHICRRGTAMLCPYRVVYLPENSCNVRPHNSEVPTSTLLREFANTFRQDIWPGKRLPEVFHDPRSLTVGAESKACLHVKCVVVDQERVLVTSANLTEAAHERNIEAGVLLNDPVTAQALQIQFESLVTRNILCRIPGI